jgi:hypothetical protein
MGPESLLPCSQELTAGPCPDPDESSSCQPIPFLLRSILILPYLYLGLLVVSFLWLSCQNPVCSLLLFIPLHMPATCPAHHIVYDLIIPIVFVKSKSYETPHNAVFSNLLSLHLFGNVLGFRYGGHPVRAEKSKP